MRCATCGHEGEWDGPCPRCGPPPPPEQTAALPQPLGPHRTPAQAPPPAGGFVVAKPPAVGTFLWPSIASMLLCCLPFGALGMVYSLMARARAKEGNWEGAQKAHRLSKVWFWCAIGASAVMLFLYLLFFIAVGSTEVPVGEREQALCLRAGDLAAWGYEHPDPSPFETFTLSRNRLDDSYELEYEYQTPDTEADWPLYITVMGSVEEKGSDAALTQNAYKLGLMIGLGGNSVSSQPLPGLPRHGDASEAVQLTVDDKLVGVYYTARKGGRVYLILATGDWLADPELFESEVSPRIEAFWDWQPGE